MKFTPKKSALLLLTIISLLLAVQVVSAASESGNIFDSFKNIFGSDFGQLYKDNWWVVDLIVYLFFFGYVGKLALGSQFGGKGGSIGIVFGVAMAIALVAFEAKTGFQLGNLGPYAMAVLVLALAFITWKFFHGLGMGNGGAAAFAVVVIYGTLATVASPLLKALRDSDNSTIKAFASIIDLLLFVAVAAVAWNGFSFVGRMFKGGGGGGLGGLFGGGGGGNNPRAAAVAERQAAAQENVVGQEENVERAQEQREVADISAIRNLTKREIKDVDRIRSDIDGVIKVLKKGRLDAAAQQEIAQKIGEIVPSAADIRGVEQQLRARIADLDAVERAEIANIEQMARTAKGAFMNDIRAMRQSQSLQNRQPGSVAALLPYKKNLDTAQSKFIDQSRGIAFKQLASTRRKLESHANAISQLEAQFAQDYSQARQYLMSGALQQAISYLEAAKGKLGQISTGLKLLGGADVNEVKQEIAAKIQRLKVEDSMRKKLTPATKAFFKGQPPRKGALRGVASKSLSAVTVLGKSLRVFRRR